MVVECQVKFNAKHKLKCKTYFVSGSGVPGRLTQVPYSRAVFLPVLGLTHLFVPVSYPIRAVLLHLHRRTGTALPDTTHCSQGGKDQGPFVQHHLP